MERDGRGTGKVEKVTDVFQQTKVLQNRDRKGQGGVELDRAREKDTTTTTTNNNNIGIGVEEKEDKEKAYSLHLDDDVDEDERVLRSFDLTSKYGPCTGMSRMERWERASRLGLDPPQHVRALLLNALQGPNHNHVNKDECIWEGRV